MSFPRKDTDIHWSSGEGPDSLNLLRQSLLRPFYGFHHPKTKWILASLSSLPTSIKRLHTHITLLQSYFEIPDDDHGQLNYRKSKDDHRRNDPAFHNLASLYLNPLGIAIYTRNESALRILLDLKVNNFSDPCFIQRWWNKGEDTYFTDFSAVHIVALALRRNFFESISLIMMAGFDPRNILYQVDHIQSSDQSKTQVFQDCLDQGFSIMNERPCLDIASFFKIISDHQFKFRYDPIMFEMQTVFTKRNGSEVKISRIRSLFRLVINHAHLHFNGSCSSTYLGILEIIQKDGFFRYISKEICNSKDSESVIDSNHIMFCEGQFPSTNETEVQRMYKNDLALLSVDERVQYLKMDRNICLGILFLWCTDISCKGRQHQRHRLTAIVVHILLDCNLMVWFLKSSNTIVIKNLSSKCCGIERVNVDGMAAIKATIIDFIRNRSLLMKKILKENDEYLSNLFKKNIKTQKKLKKNNEKKKNPFLIVDSHTIHSWKVSKKTKDLSKDFPMFSVQHKMDQMLCDTTNKSHTKRMPTLKYDDDTIREEDNLLSVVNSLNSFDEQTYFDSVSETHFSPPPLVIRKFMAETRIPLKVGKEHSVEKITDVLSKISDII